MLHVSTQQLNKTAGINGAYSTAMNVSQTLALKGQHVLVPKLGQNGGGSDVFVRTVGGAWRSACLEHGRRSLAVLVAAVPVRKRRVLAVHQPR